MTTAHVSQFTSLEAARRHYLRGVDDYAGAVRARFITIVPGQAETYRAKEADAERYRASATPDPAAHPWVTAQAQATGVTLPEAAATLLATRDAWTRLGVSIERARVGAKHALRSLTDARAMHERYRQALVELDAIAEQAGGES